MFRSSLPSALFSPTRMKARFTREHYKEHPVSGLAPIYLRLTIGLVGGVGQRADVATGVWATRKQWPAKAQQLKGGSAGVQADNDTLALWLAKAKETYLRLKHDPHLSAKALKAALVGEKRVALPLLSLADRFYVYASRADQRKAANTLSAYRTRRKSLELYLCQALKSPALDAAAISLPWLRAFERWLSQEQGYGAATVHKHVNFVQLVIGFGAHEGLLALNPLAGYSYQTRPEPRDPTYLPEAEVQALARAALPTRALQDVADAWLLCCYTGLSYVEYARFNAAEHLHVDESGQRWIRINRQKKRWYSTALVSVPVLAETAALLARYPHHWPALSNAYFNRALKEVSSLLDLSLPLTVGLARHTASHRFRNVYGFSDEDAAAICGHSIQMMNGHYSRKREDGIKQAMQRLLPAPAPTPPTLLDQLRAALSDPATADVLRAGLSDLLP